MSKRGGATDSFADAFLVYVLDLRLHRDVLFDDFDGDDDWTNSMTMMVMEGWNWTTEEFCTMLGHC